MKRANKQIRQIGFARRLKNRMEQSHPELAKKLNEEDYRLFITLFFDELSELLRSGFRVIFEGYASFYTKAIKRKCKDLNKGQEWMTFKRRLRWKPAPDMKILTEVEITEDDYLKEVEKNKR